jgi:sugar lactone lactonase YvrE
MKRILATIILCTSVFMPEAQFAYSIQSPLAAESFRTGIEAYGRGRYAESLAQFERALASESSDPLSLYWLGKSYFRLGLSSAAFDRWNEAMTAGGYSPFVASRLELAGAVASPPGLEPPERYVRVSEILGTQARTELFSRPSWIEPLADGKIILVSHGTDTLLVIDANARIINTINGGVTGLDRPFACAVLDDGTMFVTEFQSNRIVRLSRDGAILGYSGDPTGPGRLSGPQYIAADKDGFVYVSDVGFSRIVKYARDGTRVLAFGTPTPTFSGLRLPTGVAVLEDRVFVADSALKAIFAFDSFGNYLSRIETSGLLKPEGLRVIRDGKLLVADGSRVLLLDPETGAMKELYRSERKKARIVSAAFDANGELLIADFDASELAYLSDPVSRFSGLSVELGPIHSDGFPQIHIDVRVKDRYGRPVTGLGFTNFYISEGIVVKERRVEGDIPVNYLASSIRPASEMVFEGALDESSTIDMAFLLEGSPELVSRRLEARDAVSSIYASLGSNASARLVTAGRVAQPPSLGTLSAISDTILKAEPSDSWRFDSGLRLAAGSLFDRSGRRTVIYVGTGSVNERFLDGASLSELSAILEANDISLHAVILGSGVPSEALSYLVRKSNGAIYRADRPEGLSIIAESIRTSQTGRYRLSYMSTADDGFGRAYLPFSVEVYLRDRSGKDESGFFAPLR